MKSRMKKLATMMLAATVACSMAAPVFAADDTAAANTAAAETTATNHPDVTKTDDTNTNTATQAAVSSLGMFEIASSSITMNEDGSAEVTMVVNTMSKGNRVYTKIALLPQSATDEEKDAAAIVAETNAEGKSVFKVHVPADKLGVAQDFSIYQTMGTETDSQKTGWHKFSKQYTLTFNKVDNQVVKETITDSNLKSITSKIANDMTEEEGKAYADVNNSPLLVAGLIGEIYVHPKTTPEEQAAQKAMIKKTAAVARYAYSKLTDEEKANVPEIPDIKNADGTDAYEYPGAGGADYFQSTGDASKDDPLNTAPDKDKEIIVASFGTSYTDSRVATIGAVEKAIAKAYPDYSVRRVFTSNVITNHILARDNEEINSLREAMDLAKSAGVKEIIVQPTTLMSGIEYNLLQDDINANKGDIKVTLAQPLLHTQADKNEVATDIAKAAAKKAKVKSVKSAKDTAFVFMGHGTEDAARVTYTQMQTTFDNLGYKNVFVGTVEGNPESTSLENTIKKVKKAGYKNVVLRPLMVVAGDHANNDMAGDDADSWKTGFTNAGFKVTCQINGLGEIKDVQQMYVKHTNNAIYSTDIRNFQAKKVSGVKAAAKKKSVKVTFKKVKGADSYTVKYKAGKKWTTKSTKKTSYTIKTTAKNVKVQVKAVKKIGTKNYSTSYSAVKTAK